LELPIRKKLRPLSKEEIRYILTHYDSHTAYVMINSGEEYDIPAADKLEREIEETFKIIKGKPLDVYKKFINLTDQFNDIYKKYSPCKKGCSGCCKIAVLISEMEKNQIKYFLDKVNEAKNYIYIQYPTKPIIKDGITGGNYSGINCPFLENDECKIYPVRPYKCRSFISADDKCISIYKKLSDGDNERLTVVTHIYSSIIYEKIIEYYYFKKNKNIELYELRDCFSKNPNGI